MKVFIDLNVFMDVLFERPPFAQDSAQVMDAVVSGRIIGVISSHGVTTLSYFLSRQLSLDKVRSTLRWLLAHFEVGVCDGDVLACAIESEMTDYEDAVTGEVAVRTRCEYVVS